MPRIITRTFPDALMLGTPTGIKINQTRLTFTGQRGIVVCGWMPQLTVTNSVARLFVGVQIVGTALIGTPFFGAATPNLELNGMEFNGWSWAVVQDPPEGSFLELETRLNTSVVVIPADGGRLIALSFAPEVAAGPTVAVE